jgi:hypothetical protein
VDPVRKLYLLGFLWLGVSGLYLFAKFSGPRILYHNSTQPTVFSGEGGAWFQQIRRFCNPTEVDVQLRWNPPPAGLQGTGYAAACYSLAGKTDRARSLILGLEPDDQWRAAGIVFNVGHPVADAGDDLASGEIMELVVEFWPNHYMALYHAGASRWAVGDVERAEHYLTEFLEYYDWEDGWTESARRILEEIEDR